VHSRAIARLEFGKYGVTDKASMSSGDVGVSR
jgi:hypothetical protein